MNATHKSPHHTVILGAGFAGVRTAVELEKRCPRIGDCRITLIDRHSAHIYWPLLYEVCTGALYDPSDAHVGELKAGVCMVYDENASILRRRHIRFTQGEIRGLDIAAKEVQLADGTRIAYDDVVVALGVEANTYDIPGVAEHAYMMKTLTDAVRIRERIATLLAECKAGTRRRVSIVVAGGGATGTELVAELGLYLGKLIRQGEGTREAFSLTLVESGEDVLMMYRSSIRAQANRRLAQLGVQVRAKTKLTAVEPGCVRLVGPDGAETRHEADVVVWTGGVKPPELLRTFGIPLNEKGFAVVESTFAAKGVPHAYVLGDCADIRHPKTNARVPMLGQAADREAAIVAENITRALERKALIAWTPPERWMTVVPMGGKYALADLGPIFLSGLPGYAVRKAADLIYFFSILSPRAAWSLWRNGARTYHKND